MSIFTKLGTGFDFHFILGGHISCGFNVTKYVNLFLEDFKK